MSEFDNERPSKAEHLANVITGNGTTGMNASTVQRSHRFPIYDFVLIENMAKLANCSVSAMINQVIEVGIDALHQTLPKEIIEEIHTVTQAQIDKANSSVNQKLGKRKK